jgi:NAD(P)-dependent dehydrogenase (short-subunit alcohol dehydrogenase family)
VRMADKVVIVTGACSGIGLSTTRLLAAEGARVMAADVKEASDALSELARSSQKVRFFRADASRASEVAAMFEETLTEFGRLDVLVNNAGIDLPKKITDTTATEWDRFMAVNLKSVFLCSRAAIPVMRRQGGGVIVNVASELGLVGGSEIAAYSATKGGVVQLTRAMAVDHAPEAIRVNCVCPGPVDTPLLESIISGSFDPARERQSIIQKTLLKRLARPDEIARVILFLASDDSSYMTGSIVVADGGSTAR